MTKPLVEGQAFPPHFTLISRHRQASKGESWLARHDSTREQVLLRVLDAEQLAQSDWLAMSGVLGKLKGLIHPNISRVLEYDATEEAYYWSEEHVESGTYFTPAGKSPAHLWQVLGALLNGLQYAHQSGFAHGRLHPGNLLLAPSGKLHITGWGIPADLCDDQEYHPWLSPEAQNNQPPDFSDDYYSLGCLIFHSLTGQQWQPGVVPDSPLAPEIASLVEKMLQTSPYDRSVDLQGLESVLAAHFDQQDIGIQPISFNLEDSSKQVRNTRPGTRQPTSIRGQGRVSALSLVTALVGTLVLAAALFFFLSDRRVVPSDRASSRAAPETDVETDAGTALGTNDKATGPAPVAQARSEHMQALAQEQGQKLLRRQTELEAIGVSLWAGADFAQLSSAADAADDLYRNQDYGAALASYQEGTTALEALLEQAPSVVAAQVAIGDAALVAGDQQSALEAFTIASAIEGANAALRVKLARAENLAEVLSNIQEGELLESKAQLPAALAAYQTANRLDKTQARADIERVQARLRQAAFNQAMSRAFTALAARDYAVARDDFTRAQKILPDSAAPAEGLLQVQQTANRDNINKHRQTAEAQLKAWHWQEAIEAFEAALNIDATLVFANRGIEQAREGIALEDSLQRYVANPALMQTDAALNEAREALVAASRRESKPDTWLAYIDTLARLISGARIPIPVTLISDNKTSITVYKVGRLGLLNSKELTLIPGDYTILGKRSGYRDVRRALSLRAGTRPAPIKIICNEKI